MVALVIPVPVCSVRDDRCLVIRRLMLTCPTGCRFECSIVSSIVEK